MKKKPVLHNKTRTSPSMPKKLFKEGKWYLVPLYYVLMLSDLAHEGFTHSGSYRFADHIYVSKPKGRFFFGRFIDLIFLSFPSAKSFRNRYVHTRDLVVQHAGNYGQEKKINVLTVPAGIARTLHDAAEILKAQDPALYRKTVFHCLDLDGNIPSVQEEYLPGIKQHRFRFHQGDALNIADYPHKHHIIVSTGLTEFLNDHDILDFYDNCHKSLVKGGVLITSATSLHRLSDYLMRNLGELNAYYRSKHHVERLLSETKFSNIVIYRDAIGYQTIIVARK